MNDEEKKAIKIVNSLKEWGKIHFIVKDRSYARLTYNEVYLLLNLLEKLQKENEELKNQEATARKINELLVQRYSNSISVQKVKDKIEELQNGPLKINENNKYYYETEAYNKIIIQVLQELIEGR